MTKQTLFIILITLSICIALSVQAAPRTVMFEHFSQEMCSTCPETAEAISTFRDDYSYQDVVIISYWTQGSQAIPDGTNRGMEFYDEILTPCVIGDGLIDIPAPPQEYQDFVNTYNARAGESSPCTMSVICNGGNSYTIQIMAESAFSGTLMVVAYEKYTDTHGTRYACFGREFVTPYYGEDISLTAGQTLEIPKTVSVGHSGVAAWIHTSAKNNSNSRRFFPMEVLQAADSHNETSTPTPTPTGGSETPTPTPTTPAGTPTATPEIPCDDNGVTIDMPSDYFRGGDDFYVDVYLCNVDGVEYELPLFVILDVMGTMFFAPSFGAYDNYIVTLAANGLTRVEVLPLFPWPSDVGSVSGINFYAGMTNSQMSELFGDYDVETFGWGN
ncbi:hypothetical protein K8T06_04165 [bacterium]|nr:hypothetical protein [bacterium]